MMIANPEGQLMPMNTVQGGFENVWGTCERGHRLDGLNYPTPAGDCTACIYAAAGLVLPVSGLPMLDGDPVAILLARVARESQPNTQGVPLLYL